MNNLGQGDDGVWGLGRGDILKGKKGRSVRCTKPEKLAQLMHYLISATAPDQRRVF